MKADQELICDVLVIGTEGTGARAALEAVQQDVEVLAVTKGFLARSGATLTADGEIDIDSRSAKQMFGVNGSPEDSPEQFAHDMIVGGDFLNDQRLVSIHTEEAPARVSELVEWGAKLEGFFQAPGHTYPRGLWIPGLKLTRLLARRLGRSSVRVLENTMVLEMLHDTDGVMGAIAIHLPTGRILLLRSRSIILATGGAMRVFPLTTAPEELTGDGLAMALRCGVALQDMEFPMFLPYCFITPPALNGVIFSYDVSVLLAVRALNRFGDRYMAKWDPGRMERSTRDINSVAAAMEIRSGRGSKKGGTYLSMRHLPSNLVDFSTEWFPGNLKRWRAAGFDLRDHFPNFNDVAWEVAPASHFWNGGVKIDDCCRTGVPGLFAAGEGTAGIHGANRLAGNALTMTQVWGRRAGVYAARYAKENKIRKPPAACIKEAVRRVDRLKVETSGPSPMEMRNEIRRVAGDLVGIVREEASLLQALQAIISLRGDLPHQHIVNQDSRFNREWTEALQNENLLDVIEAVVRSSLVRKESRGAMYREDYPATDDDRWLCNLVVKRQGEEWDIQEKPVEAVYLSLPTGTRQYGKKRVDSDE